MKTKNGLKRIEERSDLDSLEIGDIVNILFIDPAFVEGEMLVYSGKVGEYLEFLEKKDDEILGWQMKKNDMRLVGEGTIEIGALHRSLHAYSPSHPDYQSKLEILSK